MTSRILFDASSTNPISEIVAVATGSCAQINAWNLGIGQVAQVFRVLVELGFIGSSSAGSCAPPPGVTPATIVTEGEYLPCNVPVEVGQQTNLNITTLVIQQPGYYRVHLTPSALGTAFVEAIVLTSEECEAASRACCCTPETFWQGVSLNACLTITPGGDAGHAPIFNLDACCLLQSLPPNPNPVLSDELVFLSGGACFRATIDQVFSSAIVCDSLNEQPLLPPAAGDQLVAVDAGTNCKRVDGETFVEFFETPWTGVSVTPALVITPGGVNGHGPTFSYDLCADLQALPVCACEPAAGDLVPVIQGGQCTLATWPTVDLCEQIGLLNAGVLVVGDTVPVREAGGNCKQVLSSAFGATFPLSAPDGSCIAPSYSFVTDPTSGMFYNAGNASVIISDANCTDFIEIGNSVDINAATSFVRLRGGYAVPGSNCGLIVETNGLERLRIGSQGAWNLNTGGGGSPGDVITSNGAGAPPTWQAAPAVVFPILSPSGSCVAPTYSFAASPDSGMFYDPAGVGSVVIGDDNCADFISIGASVTIGTNTIVRHTYKSTGAWEIGGTEGNLGDVIVSQGPGLPPIWTNSGATVTFPLFAPLDPIPQYSFAANPAMGMSYDGQSVNFGRYDSSNWSTSSGLRIENAGPRDTFLRGENSSVGRGANMDIRGGSSTFAVSQGEGGIVNIEGGRGQFFGGGTTTVAGGPSTNAGGGDLRLNGGNGATAAGGVVISAGSASSVNATGGSINLRTNSGGPGGANPPGITMDHHNSNQYGDPFVFRSSSFGGSTSFWYGVAGDTVDTTGANIRIWGGPGVGIGAGGDGGTVHLMGGGATGSATDGGQLLLEGGGATPGGTPGFPQLHRLIAVPVATPTLGGNHTPFVFVNGGGLLRLFGWDQDAAIWKSVTLT